MSDSSHHSEDLSRVAKNTVFLYIRSLFNLFLSLYTSRLVLMALGVDDYGIYNAVAGFVSMFWMVSGTLSGAITRFLTYEMGKGGKGDAGMIFSVAMTLLVGLIVLTLLFAEPFGVWFLNHKMTIPAGREYAANLVFQTAIITSVLNLLVTPFNALIVAHEKFSFYAFIGVGEAVLLFCLALLLVHARLPFDVLILYSIGRLLVSLIIQFSTAVFCLRSFSESHRRPGWNKGLFINLLNYSGWSLLTSFVGIWGGQGVNVALNVYTGPAVNAARGLAFTVTNSVGLFVQNFTSAIVPQVTKSLAAGEKQYFRSLVFNGSKLAFFIMLFMAVPLLMEAEFVLGLWLKEVPEYTVIFTRLAIIGAVIAMFDNILTQAQKSSGIIRNYQISISVLTAVSFVCSWIVLRSGYSPIWVYIVSLGFAVAAVAVSTVIASHTFEFSAAEIIKGIFIPDLAVWLCASIAPFLLIRVLPLGWLRFLSVLFVSEISVAVCACFISLTKEERRFVFQRLFRWAQKKYSSFHSRKARVSGSLNIQELDNANKYIYNLLVEDGPCMIARYGRTELMTLSNYLGVNSTERRSVVICLKGERAPWWWDEEWRINIGKLSGFFPLDDSSIERFCRLMLDDSAQLDLLGSWVEEEKYLDSYLNNVKKTPLACLEPFFSKVPWTQALKGKRVLVIHPFAELIEQQYHNKRALIFPGKEILPEFDLQVIKAVQTLGGGEGSGFRSWFEALEWMEGEIDKREFDIALIGCGAYGFPLAAYVKKKGKKAIHLGGSLQLLFGIIGKRWEEMPSYAGMINSAWVRPGEETKPRNAAQVEGGCYW